MEQAQTERREREARLEELNATRSTERAAASEADRHMEALREQSEQSRKQVYFIWFISPPRTD